MRMAANMPLK